MFSFLVSAIREDTLDMERKQSVSPLFPPHFSRVPKNIESQRRRDSASQTLNLQL